MAFCEYIIVIDVNHNKLYNWCFSLVNIKKNAYGSKLLYNGTGETLFGLLKSISSIMFKKDKKISVIHYFFF